MWVFTVASLTTHAGAATTAPYGDDPAMVRGDVDPSFVRRDRLGQLGSGGRGGWGAVAGDQTFGVEQTGDDPPGEQVDREQAEPAGDGERD